MNSFLEMAPTTAGTVVVGDKEFPVPGVKLKPLAYLMKRYWDTLAPLFQKLKAIAAAQAQAQAQGVANHNPDADRELLSDLLALPNDIIGAIIAAGMGHVGNQDAERIAESQPVGVQAKLLAAIIKETMPDGPVPFVEDVVKLFNAIAAEKSASQQGQAAETSLKKSRRRSTS